MFVITIWRRINILLHDCDLEEYLTAPQDRAVKRYSAMHYFWCRLRHTQSQSIIAYKTDEIFLGISGQYCIVVTLLTCPQCYFDLQIIVKLSAQAYVWPKSCGPFLKSGLAVVMFHFLFDPFIITMGWRLSKTLLPKIVHYFNKCYNQNEFRLDNWKSATFVCKQYSAYWVLSLVA